MRRPLLVLLMLAALLVALGGCSLGDDGGGAPPQVGVGSDEDDAAETSGVASAATRNTVRVGGEDAAADAAGVAGALFPSTGPSDRPEVVVLVDSDDWQTGIAAALLSGSPLGAPILLADGDELPDATDEALERLDPTGSALAKNAQVIRVGQDVARPEGYTTALIEGADAYERAAAIDRFFSAARGRPSTDVVVYSGERPEWAMPAAAWAARSGDAVLPVRRDAVPQAVRGALRAHERPNVYVLGPESAISEKAVKQLEPLARRVQRISGATPIENAIEFARFRRGGFGWGLTVPGFNFTVANADRPLDAAASAALGTRGVFAPLLLTDGSTELPAALESYFLSVQPGYEGDPSQAVYNRVWLLGDDEAVPFEQQARIDRVTELIPVQSGTP